jgi:hypothetical protein
VVEWLTDWEIWGRRDVILRQLTRKVGALPQLQQAQIAELNPEQLNALADALLDFSGPVDLVAWLAANPPDPYVLDEDGADAADESPAEAP